MSYAEIIEEYFQGKIVSRKINGIDCPPPEEEMALKAFVAWDEMPDTIIERRIMTLEQAENIYGIISRGKNK